MVINELNIQFEQLLPSNSGFYSIEIDGWSNQICTTSFCAIYIHHLDYDFKFNKILIEFRGFPCHLNEPMVTEFYQEYSTKEYGQCVGMCSDHASENMASVRAM